MLGSHLLKSWSATQENVTLSSAEAELVAAVKVCGECIGITQLANDWASSYVGGSTSNLLLRLCFIVACNTFLMILP